MKIIKEPLGFHLAPPPPVPLGLRLYLPSMFAPSALPIDHHPPVVEAAPHRPTTHCRSTTPTPEPFYTQSFSPPPSPLTSPNANLTLDTITTTSINLPSGEAVAHIAPAPSLVTHRRYPSLPPPNLHLKTSMRSKSFSSTSMT
jgi:hypothetical protein